MGFKSLKSVLENLESLKGVDSTGEAYLSSPNIADTIYEDYGRLLDVLNEDKIIKLNDHFVKVDLQKERVYTINSKVENAYSILRDNVSNDSLKSYPTYEDVGLILFGMRIFCQDPVAEREAVRVKDNNCSSNYRTKKKVVYQKAGIYFSLLAKAKNEQKHWYSLGIWHNWSGSTTPLLYMNMYFKQRCGTEWGWWQGDAQNWYHSNVAYSGNAIAATFRPYQSTRALTKYFFSASIHGNCGIDYLFIEDNM